jgi:hypothetical protein
MLWGRRWRSVAWAAPVQMLLHCRRALQRQQQQRRHHAAAARYQVRQKAAAASRGRDRRYHKNSRRRMIRTPGLHMAVAAARWPQEGWAAWALLMSGSPRELEGMLICCHCRARHPQNPCQPAGTSRKSVSKPSACATSRSAAYAGLVRFEAEFSNLSLQWHRTARNSFTRKPSGQDVQPVDRQGHDLVSSIVAVRISCQGMHGLSDFREKRVGSAQCHAQLVRSGYAPLPLRQPPGAQFSWLQLRQNENMAVAPMFGNLNPWGSQEHCCPGSLLRISIICMHFLLSVQTCLLLLVFRRFSMCRDRT